MGLKFTMVTGGGGDFFALDGQGQVWRYQWATRERPEGWKPCLMEPLPPDPPQLEPKPVG